MIPEDLRVDVHSAGFTNPIVRVVHLPTGLVETCSEYRSQRLNYAKAVHDLAERLEEKPE